VNKKILFRVINYIFFFAIAIALMYICFKDINYNAFITELKKVDYIWVILSVMVGMIANIFRALRWQMLIRPLNYNVSAINTYHAVMVGYLVNFALPRVGEISRCVVLRKTDKAHVNVLIGTVVTERIVDMLCLLLSMLLVLCLQYDYFASFMSNNFMPAFSDWIGNLTSSAYWWIELTSALILCCAIIYLLRKKILKSTFAIKMKSVLRDISSGLKSIFYMRRTFLFFLYTFLIWLCYWLTSYLTMFAIPATAGLTAGNALFLMVMGSLGWVLPVQGGFGAYHYIVMLGLSFFGIKNEQGVIFATISHESQAIAMIFFGLISLIIVSLIKQKNVNY
jgi:uncharacterized protein (TIRG00374 family)